MGRGSELEFGVGSWSMQSTYMRPLRHGYLYEEAAREARLAEHAGFDSFWMGEHHTSYDGYCPSLVAAAAYLLSSTQRIKVCAGVLLLPLHSAHRVAEGCRAVSSLAPNRLRLAMAQGYRRHELETDGKTLADRKVLWTTAVESLLGELSPRVGNVELWSGARAIPAVTRTAHYGLPLQMSGRAGTLEHMRDIIALYRSEFKRRPGGPDSKVMIMRDVWVERDQRKIEWVKACLTESWLPYADEFLKDRKGAWFRGIDVESPNARYEGSAFLATGGTVGSPAEVLAGLAPYMEIGADGIVFRIKFDGMDTRAIQACLELLSTDVVPLLRKSARTAQ